MLSIFRILFSSIRVKRRKKAFFQNLLIEIDYNFILVSQIQLIYSYIQIFRFFFALSSFNRDR